MSTVDKFNVNIVKSNNDHETWNEGNTSKFITYIRIFRKHIYERSNKSMLLRRDIQHSAVKTVIRNLCNTSDIKSTAYAKPNYS